MGAPLCGVKEWHGVPCTSPLPPTSWRTEQCHPSQWPQIRFTEAINYYHFVPPTVMWFLFAAQQCPLGTFNTKTIRRFSGSLP